MIKTVAAYRSKFILWVLIISCYSCTSNPKQIGIQPYGEPDKAIINSVTKILKETYNANVIVLDKKALPKQAFVNIKSPRYRADSLLKDLLRHRPDSIDFILGITSKDISTTKRDVNGNIKQPEAKYGDWGIFGLGYKPGKSCVISNFRLKNTTPKTYINRIQKIAVHEIGHNLELPHCDTDKCVMQDAVETIKTVDLAGFELCKSCLHKIN
ncbi:hypothetical protein [uncultured Psychroserpens sp.]|uniref:hypothetical protein n=1 Tax=uncultured Psychroserpens sp. TaxID=255436 RepID=UPI0026143F6D|nr:hypothetical protein [uncultured Psychroserpens sp.]